MFTKLFNAIRVFFNRKQAKRLIKALELSKDKPVSCGCPSAVKIDTWGDGSDDSDLARKIKEKRAELGRNDDSRRVDL